MKKFKITWGRGSVEGIKIMYKTIEIKSKNIDSIDFLSILPKELRSKVLYFRVIYTSNTKRNIDYGSYVDFIEVEEIS